MADSAGILDRRKNAERSSAAWRPYNGPLSPASRRNAIVVVRQLFNFLKRTGYLIFNPFDQVSPKVPLLKGEGAPQAFADRSLTPNSGVKSQGTCRSSRRDSRVNV